MTWPGEVGEPCLVPSGGLLLHAVVYMPDGPEHGNVCLVPALFEEKRSAHRAMVDFARALARVGWWVLHLDLSGTGNSPGDLVALTVEDWIDNVVNGVDWLRKRSDQLPTVLVGVRAGALIAAPAAAAMEPAPIGLHLWQPVVDGGRYLAQMQTRRRIQDGLTGLLEEAMERNGEVVDVDGFAVGPSLYEGLRARNLAAEKLPPGMPVQILQISARERLLPDFQALQQVWGKDASVRVQIARPFWNPHTPEPYDGLIEPALDWIKELESHGEP